jgi:hypothetical protein
VLLPVTATIFLAGEDLIPPSPEEGADEYRESGGVFSVPAGRKIAQESRGE